MYQKGRAWIEINLDNLDRNVRALQAILPPSCRLMPAVKADAYGHGAVAVAVRLNQLGIEDFCVACASEGVSLRQAGIRGQILVLGYTHPGQMDLLADYRLTQTVVDLDYARQLNSFGRPVSVHIGVDTGMHRLGEACSNMEAIAELWNCKNLTITGIYSHCCVSDSLRDRDREFTRLQEQRFLEVVDFLHRRGITGFSCHMQSSYGVLNYPGRQYDYARVGIALYGVLSSRQDTPLYCPELFPVLSLKARVGCVRQLEPGEGAGYGLDYTASRRSWLAVLSIGYADGIPRNLSNGNGYVLIDGMRAPIAGRVCMDQMLVDITGIYGVKPGDEAILIGSSKGETITAMDLAAWSGTISNEILSRMGSRLEQIVTVHTPMSFS